MDERFSRQIVIPDIGGAGQQRLAKARVLVVGAGGLGSPALLYLAAAGVGTLGVADGDRVTLSNLNRQILYATGDLERSKALIAVQRLRSLYPALKAIPYEEHILKANGDEIVRKYDVVIEASDNLETKDLMNELCVEAGIPLVWAAVERFEGQLGVYQPGHACRRCIFTQTPAPGTYPTPAELGILGATAGIVGTMEALETVKVILGIGAPLLDTIVLWDGLHGTYEKIQVSVDAQCPVCARSAAKE